ncbi:uncharacterized protein LOC100838236 [Brachypodium distachyon]|uniref:CHCH domain-containing protein n=1 Tax=Brachypodium distachyon TaxID=15368 RepID=I1IG25_BRADI|nr:uncharacterized protein LOC100838236 [Brachypodium distachyon]KQJ85608.1 hypothetical protein BRADI_4g00560v3 [Brachypodium distachyon]|eukprot:XP_003578628.1 uncharacterized protein LOC100838236 [Brachypodium distachyon]
MGRRSSGGGSFRSTPPKVRTPAPKPAAASKAPAPVGEKNNGGVSLLGSLGSALADGIGWGFGHGVISRALDSVWGPRTYRVIHDNESDQAANPSVDACSVHNKAFSDCINSNRSDISRCQVYVDMIYECHRGGGSTL